MRMYLPVTFISWLLLAVMLTATLHGVHENALAMQDHASGSGCTASSGDHAAHHHSHDPSPEHDGDHGCCDSCVNCVCHASLAMHQFTLSYSPLVTALTPFEPYRHLPEVFLSKFIPPENLA